MAGSVENAYFELERLFCVCLTAVWQGQMLTREPLVGVMRR